MHVCFLSLKKAVCVLCAIAAVILACMPVRAEPSGISRPSDSADGAGENGPDTGTRTELKYKRLSELSGKKLCTVLGYMTEQCVRRRDDIKDYSFEYYNTIADSVFAVQQGKADASLIDYPLAVLYTQRMENIGIIPETIDEIPLGIAYKKGSPLREDFDRVIGRLKQDGTLDKLLNKWLFGPESGKTVPEQDWPGMNGTLECWIAPETEPFAYLDGGGQPTGFETELVLTVAKELDYHVRFTPCDTDGRLAGLISGKADLSIGMVGITEERAEKVDFSLPFYMDPIVAVIQTTQRDNDPIGAFFRRIGQGFERSFVTDGRWRFYLQGVGTTVLITVATLALCSVLGILIYMLYSKRIGIVNKIIGGISVFFNRTPIITILMLFFYIVFASAGLSAAAVSVIVLSLMFGFNMFGVIRMGVESVDKRQSIASYALGVPKRPTFMKIIVPQVMVNIMPAYQALTVTLIKETAVLGFISVIELTMTTDLLRSMTSEALFPLLVTAVVYFLLACLSIKLVNLAVLPVSRKKEAGKGRGRSAA